MGELTKFERFERDLSKGENRRRMRLLAALPEGINHEAWLQAAIACLAHNWDDLSQCSVESIEDALMASATMGLSLNPYMQLGSIIRFKGSAVFMPMYKGLITLAKRNGRIRKLIAYPVYDGEKFEVSLGLEPNIVHVPDVFGCMGDSDRIVAVYAAAFFGDDVQFEVMNRRQIDDVRSSSSTDRVWGPHFGEMARKTVIKRLIKYLGVENEDLHRAIAYDDALYTNEAVRPAELVPEALKELPPIPEPEPSREAELFPAADALPPIVERMKASGKKLFTTKELAGMLGTPVKDAQALLKNLADHGFIAAQSIDGETAWKVA